METTDLLLQAVMGVLASTINSAVGSGSLLTLPVLLALGVPRRRGPQQHHRDVVLDDRIRRGLPPRDRCGARQPDRPAAGHHARGLVHRVRLLLVSPGSALRVVVPVLIVVALGLVVFQPRISRAVGARRERRAADAGLAEPDASAVYRSPGLLSAMGAASMYGGYFTAAQGIIYLGIIGAFTGRPMTSINAVKNLLGLLVNATAATVYVVAHLVLSAVIVWPAVLAIATGSLAGGYLGTHVAKRLPRTRCAVSSSWWRWSPWRASSSRCDAAAPRDDGAGCRARPPRLPTAPAPRPGLASPHPTL